ncbi:hypothetical protein GCM10011579_078390 [Streptomyces albiflavescens]|uniref:Uncharacterized protein n=1 Tax=Streptomyces albiflavescens TaxID=1623582 RepID=A0A917YDY4_9ACTN|nr:hypothetical protein [Streptomyces albiflavescens]GGN86515.1 hypothetical protein GCM10011579_078390 [Streptomyces albiflavescens]
MVIALVPWLLLPVAWAALPWLPPNRTFGCFVAAVQLMLSVAALSVGMPAENLPAWFLIPGLVSSVARLASVSSLRARTRRGQA